MMNPAYLGAYALDEGKDVLLTIDKVTQEEVKGSKGESDLKMVVYFREDVKPMICNATNAKEISKQAASNYIEDWAGLQIQVGISVVNAFGAEYEALRVRPKKSKVEDVLK
jgi:hypothetical protein